MFNISIIDYGIGNLESLKNAFQVLGQDVRVTRDHNEILESNGVLLPGVGAFGHAMNELNRYDLIDVLKNYAQTNKPIFGICLGMQLLFVP